MTGNSSRLKMIPSVLGLKRLCWSLTLLDSVVSTKTPKGLHRYSQVNKPTVIACLTK